MEDISFATDPDLILIVDDDKSMRLQMRQVMEQAGSLVVEVNDGKQALVAYTQFRPSLVLLDAVMPVMDGFMCCRHLRNLPDGDRLPILIVTKLEDAESIQLAFDAGATDFITKPINEIVLRQRVRHLLQAGRVMAELRTSTAMATAREEQLRLALEAAQMGTWNWDTIANKVNWSKHLATQIDIEGSGNDTYEAFLQRIHPADRDLVDRAVLRSLQEGAAYEVEFRLILPDGTIRWIASKGSVFRDATGNPVRLLGVDMDITQPKQAEAALQESKQRVTNILNSITDAFFALDGKWRFTYVNQQAEKLLQRTRLELLGKSIWDEFPAAVGSNFEQEYRQARARQIAVAFEAYYSPLNAWFAVHAYPALDGLSVYFQDISDRKRMEIQLQQTMQLQQAILNSANYTIISTSIDGTILTFNAAAEKLLGYSASEIVGKTTPVIIHDWEEIVSRARELSQELGETIEPGFEMFAIKARRGEQTEQEWTYIRKDGSRFPVLLSISAMRDANGEITGYLGIGSDITDRKQAEAQLQRQNLRSQLFAEITLKIRQSLQLESILQTTVNEIHKFLQADRVIIFRLSSDGSGDVVREAVVNGYPAIFGQRIIDPCFKEEYIQKYQQGRISAINDIERVAIHACHKNLLQQFRVKANLVVPIFLKRQLWGLLIAHQCNSPRVWSSFEIDLLRQLSDQIGIALAQAQMLAEETRYSQELARSNAELQQFASVASHDLQEPLRKIQAFGNRLKASCGDALNQQGRDSLERMQNAAGRMQTLIDDLLMLSRVTTKAQPFVTVDLNRVAKEVLSDLEVRLQQTGGKVEVSTLPTIDADPVQMQQLLQNLLSNGLKFHKQNNIPVVKLSSQLVDSQQQPVANKAIATLCKIIVEDNGIGFEEKYIDRIFNVFQRLHSRSQYEGTGIGLAICRKIVERHRGSIAARSTLGQGATFTITLPIAQPKGDNPE